MHDLWKRKDCDEDDECIPAGGWAAFEWAFLTRSLTPIASQPRQYPRHSAAHSSIYHKTSYKPLKYIEPTYLRYQKTSWMQYLLYQILFQMRQDPVYVTLKV